MLFFPDRDLFAWNMAGTHVIVVRELRIDHHAFSRNVNLHHVSLGTKNRDSVSTPLVDQEGITLNPTNRIKIYRPPTPRILFSCKNVHVVGAAPNRISSLVYSPVSGQPPLL